MFNYYYGRRTVPPKVKFFVTKYFIRHFYAFIAFVFPVSYLYYSPVRNRGNIAHIRTTAS